MVGCSIGLLALPLAFIATFGWALVLTLFFGSVVFVGKEIKDIPTTGFDKIDLAADYLGWCAGSIVAFFVWGVIQIIML